MIRHIGKIASFLQKIASFLQKIASFLQKIASFLQKIASFLVFWQIASFFSYGTQFFGAGLNTAISAM